MAELLRVYMKGKYPLKRDDDIAALLKQRMEGYVNVRSAHVMAWGLRGVGLT